MRALAQTAAQVRGQFEAAAERRIAELGREFEELLKLTPSEKEWGEACKTNCDSASRLVREGSAAARIERVKAMDRVAVQIHREVDAYVQRVVSPTRFDPKSVQQSLRQVLGGTADGPPSAFGLDSGNAKSLVLVYTLRKGTRIGPGATSVALRAYASNESSFELAGVASDDMDCYGDVNVAELHSPVAGELWLFLWGQMTGANGPNMRMRIYGYDRAKFRPIWMPENVWGTFTVRVTERGFTVDGSYYREDAVRHDSYSLSEDGVYPMRQ
jgi:hypothetical protein